MTTRQKIRIVGVIIVVMLFTTGIFAATFFLTALVYQRIDRQPSAFGAISLTRCLACFLLFNLIWSGSLFWIEAADSPNRSLWANF